MYQGVFTGLTGTMFGTNYTSANGYGEEKYGVNVTWSKSRKQDLGIDIKFLNDNLSFVVDFFKERRDNIFLQRSTIPSYAGWIENPYANLGVVENKGIELAMDYTCLLYTSHLMASRMCLLMSNWTGNFKCMP